MARSTKKKAGARSRGPGLGLGHRRKRQQRVPTTISAPRADDRHQRTLVIDFDGLIMRVGALPEPDATSLHYTAAATDLIHAAADPGIPFGHAAPGVDPEASFVEGLLAIPDETFDAAHDLLNLSDNDQLDNRSRPRRASQTPKEAARVVMADHVLDHHFFGALFGLIRYSPPESSAEAGEDLL